MALGVALPVPPYRPEPGASTLLAVDASDPPRVAVAVARTQSELQAVAALLESRYAERGYVLSCSEADPATDLVLMAVECGDPIGTLTLRFDGPRGLRADETFREQLDAARAAGRCVCELGRLAVAGTRRSSAAVNALFSGAHELVRDRPEISDVFIEVNPRHAAFYRRAFGFEIAGAERTCPRVLAPAVLLRLEVAAFETSTD